MKASRLIFSNVVRIEKNGCGVTRTSAVQSMQVLLIRHQPVTQQPGSAEQSERLRPMSGNPNRSHHCAYDLHWVQIGAGSPVLYPLQAVGCGRAVVADPCQGCEAGRHQTHQHHCSRRAGCSSVRVSVGGVVPLWSRVLCGVPQRSAGSPRDTARTHWLRVAVQLVSCRVRPASWLRDMYQVEFAVVMPHWYHCCIWRPGSRLARTTSAIRPAMELCRTQRTSLRCSAGTPQFVMA